MKKLFILSLILCFTINAFSQSQESKFNVRKLQGITLEQYQSKLQNAGLNVTLSQSGDDIIVNGNAKDVSAVLVNFQNETSINTNTFSNNCATESKYVDSDFLLGSKFFDLKYYSQSNVENLANKYKLKYKLVTSSNSIEVSGNIEKLNYLTEELIAANSNNNSQTR